MTLPFIEDCIQSTTSINASFKLRPRNCTTPHVNDSLEGNPHDINKVPIQNSKVHCSTTTRCCTIQSNQTNSLILKTLNHMKTVKSSCLVKSTSKDTITKSEGCSSVLKVLAIHKQQSLSNCSTQMQFTKTFIVMVHCMLCPISCKVTPQ